MGDLKAGTVASGVVVNVTPFGCFVDIGVENDGLIHVSQMSGRTLAIGNRVTVNVISVEVSRKRIQLSLQEIL